MARIRLLIADDQPLFLEGLRTILTLNDPELEVVSTAANGKEAVEGEKKSHPDVALLDIRMPVMDGIDAARIMRERNPDLKVIMLTTFNDRELIASALHVKVNGYILKDAPVPQVIQAIRTVFQGNVLISPRVAEKLGNSENAYQEQERLEDLPKEMNYLTSREQEIFFLLAAGENNSRIADELFLSEKTVRNYVSNIYEVLGVHNRSQAIFWALDHGLSLGKQNTK